MNLIFSALIIVIISTATLLSVFVSYAFTFKVNDWHSFYVCYWRRYAGWFPVQFCMTCGKWYWGGLPRVWIVKESIEIEHIRYPDSCFEIVERWKIKNTWQAWWKDYCSRECCDNDPSVPPPSVRRKADNV